MTDHVANIWMWGGFATFLLIALTIDAVLFSRMRSRSLITIRLAITWTLVWVFSALVFNFLFWWYMSVITDQATANLKALQFFTGYIIEKALSVDNLFVFYLVFEQLRVPGIHQQRVFTFGIWGAVVMRLGVILAGTWLISMFHWVLYIMGAILLLTGIKIMLMKQHQKDVTETAIIRFVKRYIKVTPDFDGEKFFTRRNGVLMATPLFLAVIFIEFSDLVFALDSIPAIFSVTRDPFIIWTSNIFAILGLRAMYFILARMVDRFYFLRYGVALILVFIGTKMLIEPWYKVPIMVSLTVILTLLVSFTLVSWYATRRMEKSDV